MTSGLGSGRSDLWTFFISPNTGTLGQWCRSTAWQYGSFSTKHVVRKKPVASSPSAKPPIPAKRSRVVSIYVSKPTIRLLNSINAKYSKIPMLVASRSGWLDLSICLVRSSVMNLSANLVRSLLMDLSDYTVRSDTVDLSANLVRSLLMDLSIRRGSLVDRGSLFGNGSLTHLGSLS